MELDPSQDLSRFVRPQSRPAKLDRKVIAGLARKLGTKPAGRA